MSGSSSTVQKKNETEAMAATKDEGDSSYRNCPSPKSSVAPSCDCPNNRCQPFQFLPMQQGIMITLRRNQHHPHQHCATATAAAATATLPKRASTGMIEKDNDAAAGRTLSNHNHPHHHNHTISAYTPSTISSSSSWRLEIHPQKDANLNQFHPNIYIPEVLLEYPDQLIKYGGGGERRARPFLFINFFVCL